MAHRRFPNELLVQLADQGAAVRLAQLEVAAVWDGAARRVQCEHSRLAGADCAVHPIQDEARLQCPDPRAGVAPRQHLHHQVELFAAQRLVWGRAAQHRVEVIQVPSLGGGGGDDDLRQRIKGARHGPQRLDVAFGDGLGDDGGIQEILGVAWEQQPPAGLADMVPGAADALQRGGDGGRRLHEGHRVKGADVDAHFQRVRRHDGLELAFLQASLHFRADFP